MNYRTTCMHRLFENGHILDLASRDKRYRTKSIDNLSRVVEETRRIRRFFPDVKATDNFNAGGSLENDFVTESFRTIHTHDRKSLETFKDLETVS